MLRLWQFDPNEKMFTLKGNDIKHAMLTLADKIEAFNNTINFIFNDKNIVKELRDYANPLSKKREFSLTLYPKQDFAFHNKQMLITLCFAIRTAECLADKEMLRIAKQLAKLFEYNPTLSISKQFLALHIDDEQKLSLIRTYTNFKRELENRTAPLSYYNKL